MTETTKYFHDRLILVLLSTNVFLAVLTSIAIAIRLTDIHESYIAEYRSNLGLSAFKPGHASTFIGFIVFVIAVAIFHTVISRRIYHLNHRLAAVFLSFGTLLIILAAIVSNALLGLG